MTFITLNKWFNETYGHLGFKISEPHQNEEDLKFYFYIQHTNNKTNICRVNLEKIVDLTGDNIELRKMLFTTLLKHHGCKVCFDFRPVKKIKQFELNG
jgi:hypothetical protein